MTFLRLSDVSKRGENNFHLRDINLTHPKLKRIAVVGETGSGKSTLLKIIAGLLQPDTGEVMFEDEPVYTDVEKLVPGHPGIAYLSQHFELPKFLRVEQVLAYANTLADDDALALYKICQIDHLVNRKTDQLSGGEKQRIAMARLLISSPRLLLLDEPFSHLDLPHKNTLKTVIRDIGDKLKITSVLVSHDPGDTLTWASKIIVLKDGKIVQQGTPSKIYSEPANEYVAGLFGKYNLLSQEQTELFGLAKGKKIKKPALIRPENIHIVPRGKKGLKAKVNDVIFFGGHHEVIATVGDKVITLTSNGKRVDVGDTIYLSISK